MEIGSLPGVRGAILIVSSARSRPEEPVTSTTSAPSPLDRTGLALGLGCYLLWGFLPLYFNVLDQTGSVEMIAQRAVWGLVFCLLVLPAVGQWRQFAAVLWSPRTLAVLGTAAALVGVNWYLFVWGVTHGHVVDASLGYYVNPLVTVLLAVLVLRERLRRAQVWALGFGALAVVVIATGSDGALWLSLGLALTFGGYGLVKNRVGRTVGALPGLAVETAFLTPFALAYLVWLGPRESLVGNGVGYGLLVASLGVVTVVPLLLFSGAARRLPLSVVGLLQYLTPSMQLAIGVLVLDEPMTPTRWVGFSLVWVALVILGVDGVRAVRATPPLDGGTATTPDPSR